MTGDGLQDLCGRTYSGIMCGISSGSRFDQARRVTSDYSDPDLWAPPNRGTTLRWGDLDADGSEDVCGVDNDQLLCATLPRSLDPDGDGALDALDNCSSASDPTLADTGRVGGTGADGIGNACQCGDLTLDGAVTAADVSRFRAFLANPGASALTQAELARCAVARPLSGACNVGDLVVLHRGIAALAPGVSQIWGLLLTILYLNKLGKEQKKMMYKECGNVDKYGFTNESAPNSRIWMLVICGNGLDSMVDCPRILKFVDKWWGCQPGVHKPSTVPRCSINIL